MRSLDTNPLDETVARISLHRKDGTIAAYALIDTTDAAFVNQWRWHWGSGYVVRGYKANGHRGTIFLHRELLNLSRTADGWQGDHMNHDTLDNRRANLRVVSVQGNQQNKRSYVGSRSQYRGVNWSERNGAWEASVGMDRHRYHLGIYANEVDAARAAARWRAEYMPMAVEDPELLVGEPPRRLVRGQVRGERHGLTRLLVGHLSRS